MSMRIQDAKRPLEASLFDLTGTHTRILKGYFVDPGAKKVKLQMLLNDWGRMQLEVRGVVQPGNDWGFGNGSLTFQKRGEDFDERLFMKRFIKVREKQDAGPPKVAAVPDMVMGGDDSLEYSLKWVDNLRKLEPDWPWFLVIQDGMDPDKVESYLDWFDGIFLGGSKDFKAHGSFWLKMARDHNLPFHYGGCGTVTKLGQAYAMGADSFDTLDPVRTWDMFYKFSTYYRALEVEHHESGLVTLK